MKNKRQYPDDDGRVIAPMNVEGMPWYAKTNLPGASGGEQLSKRQARMATWAALGAAAQATPLQAVVDELALPATVINGRAEEQALKVDVVTARAVAPMTTLLGYAQPYLQRGAQGLFLKGEKAEAELIEARKVWHFESSLSVSRSDPRGRIVSVRSLRRVHSR